MGKGRAVHRVKLELRKTVRSMVRRVVRRVVRRRTGRGCHRRGTRCQRPTRTARRLALALLGVLWFLLDNISKFKPLKHFT